MNRVETEDSSYASALVRFLNSIDSPLSGCIASRLVRRRLRVRSLSGSEKSCRITRWWFRRLR